MRSVGWSSCSGAMVVWLIRILHHRGSYCVVYGCVSSCVLPWGRCRALEKEFVRQAEERGLHHLYGHPISGGIRITMYNWVPDESVHEVIQFMEDFAEQHRQGHRSGDEL
eukprot:m.168495 g.168495  ORF g.168495 m.168495 type:complete len:110 (-) comp18209_c1_seq1:23-352(-)